ncbi:MAG: hypothetical protein P8Y58_12525 [Novosphingobium sp.]
MVPDIDLLIGSALRAMKDVVAPAIPSEKGVAAEQAGLIIGVLSLLQQRVGFEGARSRKELEIAVELAEQLVPVLSDPGALKAGLEAARQGRDEAMDERKRDGIRKALLACLASAIDNEGDREAQDRLLRAVLNVSSRQTSLTRAWSLPSGFEPAANGVDPLIALTER